MEKCLSKNNSTDCHMCKEIQKSSYSGDYCYLHMTVAKTPELEHTTENLPIDFIAWYSGMDKSKIRKAYERYKVECVNV